MQRWDIINQLIEKHQYKSYLEIGTQRDECLGRVICEYKVGVDPDPIWHSMTTSDQFFKLSSDKFFKKCKRKFDIIFIDGLHHSEQVKRDINNSLDALSEKGTIIVHDCNPLTEEAQIVPAPAVVKWNGDVWKAWVFFRFHPNLDMYVINIDEGLGIIRWGAQKNFFVPFQEMTYKNFVKNRKEWLNLKEVDEL